MCSFKYLFLIYKLLQTFLSNTYQTEVSGERIKQMKEYYEKMTFEQIISYLKKGINVKVVSQPVTVNMPTIKHMVLSLEHYQTGYNKYKALALKKQEKESIKLNYQNQNQENNQLLQFYEKTLSNIQKGKMINVQPTYCKSLKELLHFYNNNLDRVNQYYKRSIKEDQKDKSFWSKLEMILLQKQGNKEIRETKIFEMKLSPYELLTKKYQKQGFSHQQPVQIKEFNSLSRRQRSLTNTRMIPRFGSQNVTIISEIPQNIRPETVSPQRGQSKEETARQKVIKKLSMAPKTLQLCLNLQELSQAQQGRRQAQAANEELMRFIEKFKEECSGLSKKNKELQEECSGLREKVLQYGIQVSQHQQYKTIFQLQIGQLSQRLLQQQQKYNKQIHRLQEKLEERVLSEQRILKQSNQMHQLLKINKLFLGEVITEQADRQYIINEVQKIHKGKQISKTKLLYLSSIMSDANPHASVDNISNYIILVRCAKVNKEGRNYVIALYSESPLQKDKEKVEVNEVGFISAVTNQCTFFLKKRANKVYRLTQYDHCNLIFGLSQVKICLYSNKLSFNMGNPYCQFDTSPYIDPQVFMGDSGEECEIIGYEVYQIFFQGEQKKEKGKGQGLMVMN